jgi:hypothetical protein
MHPLSSPSYLLICCPTYPDTLSAQHHHAGAVSRGCRLRLDLAAEQRVRNRRGHHCETLRLAMAQEIGHSGSLGSIAGGHATNRALGLSRARKTCLQPCSERLSQPPCFAVLCLFDPCEAADFNIDSYPSLATRLSCFSRPLVFAAHCRIPQYPAASLCTALAP